MDARSSLAARRTSRLEQFKRELEKKVSVYTVTLDVRDRKAVESELLDLPENFRNIDLLINNAGLALGLGKAHEVDLDDFKCDDALDRDNDGHYANEVDGIQIPGGSDCNDAVPEMY